MNKLLIILCLFSFNALAKVSVKNTKEIKKLDKKGINIDKGSKVILNQHMKEKGYKSGDAYEVQFVCTHKNKTERCQLAKINYPEKKKDKKSKKKKK